VKNKKIIYPLGWYQKKKREGHGLGFGKVGIYNGVNWGIHLGEDIVCKSNTPVRSIASGKIVYAGFHPGSKQKGNWGHIIIIKHPKLLKGQDVYSLYGHLGSLEKKKKQSVRIGERIGRIGSAYTQANGWWPAHLHFSIYTGPWQEVVLPGYYKKKQGRTRLSYWKHPSEFINGLLK